MKLHVFRSLAKETDWQGAVYFDVETVETLEEMQKVKEGNIDVEQQLEYLNPRRAKYFAAGLWLNRQRTKKIAGLEYKKFYGGVIYYNTKPLTAKEIAEYLFIIAETYGRNTFVAHNGKKFDFLIFLENATLHYVKSSFFIRKGRNYYKLIDTLDISKTFGAYSLQSIAEKFNLKGKNLYTALSLQDYNVNDVYVLMNIAKQFQALGFEATPTRTSRKWIQEQMDRAGLECIKQDVVNIDYIGGRTEMFRHLGFNLNVFDANSLYPSVMSLFKFPALYGNKVVLNRVIDSQMVEQYLKDRLKELWQKEYSNPFELKEAFEENFDTQGLFIVRIKGIKRELPEWQRRFAERYFPFSYYENGKRYFRLKTDKVYQVQGYETAMLHFFDWELIDGYTFSTERLFFADSMAELYRKRRELKKQDNDLQLLYKIIMNASYGLFGLRDTVVKSLSEYDRRIGTVFMELRQGRKTIDVQGEKQAVKGILYSDVLTRQEVFLPEKGAPVVFARDFSAVALPIWATHITSSARFWLHAVMLFLTKLGRDIWYCDTDSVFTNANVSDFVQLNLIGDDLLQWKYEYTADKVVFFAPKSYVATIDDTVKIKAKGTGNALLKQFFSQYTFRSGQKIVDNQVKYILKRFANPMGIPKKIPQCETEYWESTWNDNELTFFESFDHSRIIQLFPEIAEKYLEALGNAAQTIKNELALSVL